MSIKIKKLKIENLFEIKDVEWDLNDVTVLVGKNGSGKSTILNIMKSLMMQEADKALYKCSDSEISFDDGSMIKHHDLPLDTNQLKSFMELMQSIVSKNNKKLKSKNSDITKIGSEIKKLNEVMSGIEVGDKKRLIKTGVFQIKRSSDANLRKIEASDLDKIEINEDEYGEGEGRKFDIPFEYISTINMSANSLNEVKSSDGNRTTVLDMEINKEILRLREMSKENRNLFVQTKERFVDSINSLFSESDKEVLFEDRISFKSTINNKKLSIKDLSSGERQLVYTFLKASIAAQNDAILLMDEPEISLHLAWQEKLIENLRKINPNGQIIIVTHSPAVVMNGWMNSYVDIKNIEKRH
ncbi:TPA: AAA family ATPase [Klebsiella pneumoniae]